MKNHQDNTNALPALLRTANGGDTLETNSLCCAAAGIIAPLRATAETLIPHEKLRGAALADATLNAQERPFAQPAVGYTHHSRTRTLETEIFSDEELADLTGYKQRAHQRRWLNDRNWVFVESQSGRPLAIPKQVFSLFEVVPPSLEPHDGTALEDSAIIMKPPLWC